MKAATRPVEKASMWITRARLALGEYGGRDSAIPSGGGGKQTTGREGSSDRVRSLAGVSVSDTRLTQ